METLNDKVRLRFLFIKKKKKDYKTLENHNCIYKNTFIRFSACHRGHTADPDNFYNPKNSEDPRSFFFFGMFLSINVSGFSSFLGSM